MSDLCGDLCVAAAVRAKEKVYRAPICHSPFNQGFRYLLHTTLCVHMCTCGRMRTLLCVRRMSTCTCVHSVFVCLCICVHACVTCAMYMTIKIDLRACFAAEHKTCGLSAWTHARERANACVCVCLRALDTSWSEVTRPNTLVHNVTLHSVTCCR